LFVEFSKPMVQEDCRGNDMFVTDSLESEELCDAKSFTSETVKTYDFYVYDSDKAPYTLSYVANDEEALKAKATDGTYLQNFAGKPITITEIE